MNNTHFTPENIEEIGEALRNAFLATFKNLGAEEQAAVVEFWKRHLQTCKPYFAVTPSGLAEYQRKVFGDTLLSDFMLQLSSNFFLLWGACHQTRLGFLETLAMSLCVDNGTSCKDANYEAVPYEIRQRMSSFDDVLATLRANGWLVVLLLAPSFMSYTEYMPEAKPRNRGQVS